MVLSNADFPISVSEDELHITEQFEGDDLREVISLSFSDAGYTISGRGVSRENVAFHHGLTKESAYKSEYNAVIDQSLHLSQLSPPSLLTREDILLTSSLSLSVLFTFHVRSCTSQRLDFVCALNWVHLLTSFTSFTLPFTLH